MPPPGWFRGAAFCWVRIGNFVIALEGNERNMWARRKRHQKGVIKFGGLVLDQARCEVTVHGEAHHLTPVECRLLATFMRHAGQVLTREFLMQEVWETEFSDDTRTLEVHVSWLRRKIEEDPANPQLIQTVRGVGYMFAGF